MLIKFSLTGLSAMGLKSASALAHVVAAGTRRCATSVAHSDLDAANQELNELFGTEHLEGQQSTSARAASQHVSVNPAHLRAMPRPGSNLTHVDSTGKASMVDVSEKPSSRRTATASASVMLGANAFQLVAANCAAKGDVLAVAQLAGIMGAKHTSSLIPLCHNIPLSKVHVDLELDAPRYAVHIKAHARTVGQTGVEMEALTAASVAALTVYDMCKAVSKDVVITNVRLEAKAGGLSGDYQREL